MLLPSGVSKGGVVIVIGRANWFDGDEHESEGLYFSLVVCLASLAARVGEVNTSWWR